MKNKLQISILFFLLFSILSCEKWLDIYSDTEIPSDRLFADESGFKDAVNGVYIKMGSWNLYGKALTWNALEYMAFQYAKPPLGNEYQDLTSFDFKKGSLKYTNEGIWRDAYNVIACANNVLRYHDKVGSQVLKPLLDSILRGEMLGLRAYMHFDILRMYGKGGLDKRRAVLEDPAIPYSTGFDQFAPKMYSHKEVIDMLIVDLEKASAYLENDPIRRNWQDKDFEPYYKSLFVDGYFGTSYNSIYKFRKMRMNYYAVQGLLARIYMWEGSAESKAKALNIAEAIINQAVVHNAISWVTTSDIKKGDYYKCDLTFTSEHLFTLFIDKLSENQREQFDASSPGNNSNAIYIDEDRVFNIYEADKGYADSDWRKTECLKAEGNNLKNYSVVKLRQHKDQDKEYAKRVPLIRFSEMYYIAAECLLEPGKNQDIEKAIKYINTIRNKRNIPEIYDLSSDLELEKVQEEIKKEYMKEFVGEGQLFYFYKRMNYKSILGKQSMTDNEYQFPLPEEEGRVINK